MPGVYQRSASAVTWTTGEYEGTTQAGKYDGRMYVEGDVNVQFTFNTNLTMTVSDGVLSIEGLDPGRQDTSDMITVTTATNNAQGYTLNAMVGDTTHESTSLLSGAATIASIGYAAGGSSTLTSGTWGYQLNNGTADGAFANYNGFANPLENVVLKETSGPTVEAGDVVGFRIGAYAAAGQPSGVYTNTITFASVANGIDTGD